MSVAWRSTVLPLLALGIGLAGLGVLEYRWTGELARAERDRLRAGMSAAAGRFADDLDRELRLLVLAFRPTPWPAPEEAARYARKAEEWALQATDARLLRFVLIADGGNGSWRLRRLEDRTFVYTEWTADLQPVRERLEAAQMPGIGPEAFLVAQTPALVLGSRPPPAPPRPGEDSGTFPLGPPPPRPGENPAEAVPASPPMRGEDMAPFPRGHLPMHHGNMGSLPPGPPRDRSILILMLDPAVLHDRLLAALAARHFAGLDCDLAVASGVDAGRVIWASRPGFPDRGFGADVVTPLLAMAPFDGGRHFGGPWPSPGLHGPPPWHSGVVPDPPPPPRARPPREPPPRERAGAWRLLVAQRSGSLDAAMARTRGRNLAIGFGVLVLLAGSAALLALSAQRAQALARQQVAFVAGVSHELRTPLAAIRSAGQNLADGIITDAGQVRRYGGVIRQEGERLTALVEQTLELSGMLGRGGSVRLAEVDVAALVKELVGEVDSAGRVAVDLPDGLPLLAGDAAALRSALGNLVDNALKHGGGESVAVRARVAATARGRELALVVEDSGPGVGDERPARLFEPFYRGVRARERRVAGSGLGLSVVRRVAEAHGGRVTVGAGPGGRGAAFTLHLPLAPTEART